MIEVEQLTKRYGSVKPLITCRFVSRRERFWASLAPTAPARPTTMRILTCFLPPPQRGRHASQA